MGFAIDLEANGTFVAKELVSDLIPLFLSVIGQVTEP